MLFALYPAYVSASDSVQLLSKETGGVDPQQINNFQKNREENKPHAQSSFKLKDTIQQRINHFIAPESNQDFRKLQLNQLTKFQYDNSKVSELPRVQSQSTGQVNIQLDQGRFNPVQISSLNFFEAVKMTLARHPQISQSIANLAAQNATIDIAKASYYPQISGGIGSGDMTSGERGRQVISLNATQMVYDFGKVKSSVDEQKSKLLSTQASVLVSIDDIALQVASTIVAIQRYQDSSRIANQQISGISRITEIANLRANAGISSQADPIQAQSYLEAARSNLMTQQTQLRIYQERLRTLLGMDVSNKQWQIPDSIIKQADIYTETEFNKIPKMIEAQTLVDVAKFQKKQVDLSRYPTLSVKGSLSQALNGVNPNNNKDNGYYNSVMFEASSNIYQGGATASRSRAASYAEEAARSRVNSVYLDVLNQTRATRENIDSKQQQMTVLAAQQAITIRTKELYQEQYKLGTRTVVDLLNAEQAIHSANLQLESNRYDIYDSLVQYIAVTGKTRDAYQLNHLSIQGVEIQP